MLKKVAAINDMSGIGKCSLTVAIPILSALKTQCCPYPTAILSSQTGYPKFTYLDFTSHMQEYNRAWKELDVSFDTIYSGFLGSIDQIDIVRDFIKSNNNEGNFAGEIISTKRRSIPGSVAFVPSVAGLIIAGEVVKDIIA